MPNVWMVRAGEDGRLFDKFAKGYVAVGWRELGDISSIKTQSEIRKHYSKNYPDEKQGAIGNQIAMIYKFRSVMKVGDKMLTYNPKKREFLIDTPFKAITSTNPKSLAITRKSVKSPGKIK